MKIEFVGFDNHPLQPHNTCGQAVIASIFRWCDAYPRDRSLTDRELMDYVLTEFGPNWPLRNMVTHPKIIVRALQAANIQCNVIRGNCSKSAYAEYIRASLERGHVVIVLLDLHVLHLGPRFTLHWAVITGYEAGRVVLVSWGREYRIAVDDLFRSQRSWFLPPSFKHFMIEVQR